MSEAAIEVLHLGSASRDLTDDDRRGWRLGGGVTYAALTTARLGLRTAAVMGADRAAASAAELDLLREAGVELRVVPLAESPVFRNDEAPAGRIQLCLAPGEGLPVIDLPRRWTAAIAWSVVPVAAEIGDAWAPAVPERALLVLGWQGWLRNLVAGRAVVRRPPAPSAMLRRADLVGVSRHDLAPGADATRLNGLIKPGARLVLTDGARGGRHLGTRRDGAGEWQRYEAVIPDAEVDPTGAGDVFLAAMLAAIIRPSILPDGGSDVGSELAFAAAAASLAVERPGVLGVPDLAATQARFARGQ
ncbi:MAG: PfkB family carbohydrate kinase [Candidatus Limnocylindrales bacterium]